MARISAAIIVVYLTTVLFVGNGQSKVIEKRDIEIISWNDLLGYLCKQGSSISLPYSCNAYTTTTTIATTTETTAIDDDESVEETTGTTTTTTTTTTTAAASSTTELTGSALQRAHWCQFKNGSYLSLGQTFIYNKCSLCQCIQSRAIRCSTFQCMSAYCIDGSTPYVQEGQCCQQCGYENVSTSCLVNGINFPHGTLLRRTTDNIQCWCQMGSVECRKSSSSLTSLDLWGDGTAVYVIVVIIIGILLVGVLLCCGGGLIFYYYYNKKQQTFQEAYAQYYSNAGWQPMSEDGQVIADEKQAEAEGQQYSEQISEQIPPPYAFYNGSTEQQST